MGEQPAGEAGKQERDMPGERRMPWVCQGSAGEVVIPPLVADA